jgi:CubicO group peptidase (beta-lactamase class C family)
MLLLSNYSTEEIVRRLRHIPPAFSFRAGYGYSNLMFITAGLVIATVSGLSWDEFIRQRIFEPLGMTDSVPGAGFLSERSNIATPHEDVKDGLQCVQYRADAHVGAAGAICASVADMARWLRMQLNSGSLDGKSIVDPAILAETHTPHTPIRLSAVERRLLPSRHFAVYGLGWMLSDIHGRLTIRHTGGVDGMLSSVAMFPEEKLGLAVFTNKLPNYAFNLLTNHLVDRLLGAAGPDWLQVYRDFTQEDQARAQKAQEQRASARIPGTHPALPLEKYAGRYDSPLLGGATLSSTAGGLHIQLEAHASLAGRLEHWHYDTFLCHWDDPVLGESLLPFISDGQGQVAEFRAKIREDWIDPLEHVFKKVA